MPSGGSPVARHLPAAAFPPAAAGFPLATAAFPLAAAGLAVCAAAVTGLSQASALPPEIAARFYGFFLQQYPLFTFALIYALARIVAMAATSTASRLRRVVGALVGATLLFALSLYPTFGGLVLRAGFATGGMTFLTYQPMNAAFAIGAAASAFVFGSALAVSRILIGGGASAPSWGRRLAVGLFHCGTGFLALWFAFAVIGQAHPAGFGPWPRRALSVGETGVGVSLVLAAFLPHAILVWLALRGRSRRKSPDVRSIAA
ncbi:hypothetical protein FPV16_04135 [Methylobacterium sp. W2]|uniref:hypothetical protein n=1 Tax=Methylobacterium sp. W2 TaxID=2598107 RepID=UPI001D0CAB07|nr:hypothetical protein [Methylobacterium sp. W2]MCC0805416.1 hypothetical protein [Methylobacterium sp. W2]